MFALLRKEINTFLSTLTAYVVIVVFLLATGLFLWVFPGNTNVLDGGYADLKSLFFIAPWIFLFLIPAISMRSFSEEKRSGTLELLYSRPLNHYGIIMAKYLAVLGLVLFSLLPTLIYYFSVWILGEPAGNIDLGGFWGSFIGLFFLAAIYVSIGIFASSLTDNQVIAFILGMLISFLVFTGFEYLASLPLFHGMGHVVSALGINEHYASMSRGVIDSRDLVYFISVTSFFIVLTRISAGRSLKRDLVHLPVAVGAIALLMLISAFGFFRIDLTTEKKYTLSHVSRNILEELPGDVEVEVYLDGDLPAGFKKLSVGAKELLEEFRIYSNRKLEFSFTNPAGEKDPAARQAFQQELLSSGLKPSNAQWRDREGGISQKLIFPGAIVRYNGIEMAVNLLNNNPRLSGSENLNRTTEGLEYSLINAIHTITRDTSLKVAFLEGHGELYEPEVAGASRALSYYYTIDRGQIGGQYGILDDYAAVIIARPRERMTEQDKLVLDQYLMKGGRILWLVEPVAVDKDSLMYSSMATAWMYDLNLEDMLFTWGVRLENRLIQDTRCLFIPVNTALAGDPPQYTPMPWLYFPLLSGTDHPVSRNLNLVMSEFASLVDTVKGQGNIEKSIVLRSGSSSRTVGVPTLINLRDASRPVEEEAFNTSDLPVAVMLEGEFLSPFRNRMPENILPAVKGSYSNSSVPTKMMVVSDADIIRNEVRVQDGKVIPLELGRDMIGKELYGNKDFIVNAVNYLVDDSGLMELRTRKMKIRLLDTARVNQGRMFWQMVNVLGPLVIVLLMAVIITWRRKIKYSR